MAKRNPQYKLLKDEPKAYGGDLLKTRKGRSYGRPLDTRSTMHLVLRSTKAIGEWSFWKPINKNKIKWIISKFSKKYGIKILSMANVGNHLHFQIKLSNRYTFKPFIRAITSAIAMGVTGASRINPLKKVPGDRFWDRRPFTRVVQGFRAFLNLKDYIKINQLEGFGFQKPQARFFFEWNDLKDIEIDSG
jgi:REP element-mobilizing transposase RayT